MTATKTLLLMRHAKSSWTHDDLSDEERPLNKRGRDAARTVGTLLRDRGLAPDAILCSSAERARDTAARVAKAGRFECPIEILPALYLSGPGAYVSAISRAAHGVARLLVVGHNPDVELLVTRLTGAEEPMPTAAVACITLDAAAWSGVALNPRGLLEAVYRPKDL